MQIPIASNIVTFAKEVLSLTGFVCGFVSLFVDNITQNLWTDFDEIFRISLKRKKCFNFESDPDYYLDLLNP